MHDVTYPEGTAAAAGLAGCHVCLKLAPVDAHECPRCGSGVHVRNRDSLQRTLALLLTATVLFIPANVLPIMTTSQLGTDIDSTILGGVILPGLPDLVCNQAESVFAARLAPRNAAPRPLYIESELFDRAGTLRALHVVVPDVHKEFASR